MWWTSLPVPFRKVPIAVYCTKKEYICHNFGSYLVQLICCIAFETNIMAIIFSEEFGIKVCSNKGPRPFQRDDNNEIAKIGNPLLKSKIILIQNHRIKYVQPSSVLAACSIEQSQYLIEFYEKQGLLRTYCNPDPHGNANTKSALVCQDSIYPHVHVPPP